MGRRQSAEGGPPDVKPLDVDGVRTVAIVTVFWGVAFVLLAFRQGALNDAGNGWWMWTCLAGVGLGLLGLEYCRKRRDAIARAALDAEAAAPDDEDDWSGVGDWSQLPDEPDDEFRYDTDDHDVPPPSTSGEFASQPSDDQQTIPYSPAGRPPPGHTTGEMPAAAPITGEQPLPPAAATPLPPAQSAPEPPAQPATPPPAPIQQPLGAQPEPPTPAPAQQPPVQQRPAAHVAPAPPPPRPASPPVTPPRPAQQPATERPGQPEQWPATGEPDAYSTGALHAAPAGYSPEPGRRHPRDREFSARTGEFPAARPPAPSQPYEPLADEDPPDPGRPAPRSRPYVDPARQQPPPYDEPAPSQPSRSAQGSEFSEFFDDIPPRSEPDDDSDSLLGDLVGDTGDGRRERRAADDDDQEYRGRRSRRSS